MKQAFIILTLDATATQQEAIRAAFEGRGWWHYFPQAWLILDELGTLNVVQIRETIRAVAPGLIHYVFQVQPGAPYTGFSNPEWHKWMYENWKAY